MSFHALCVEENMISGFKFDAFVKTKSPTIRKSLNALKQPKRTILGAPKWILKSGTLVLFPKVVLWYFRKNGTLRGYQKKWYTEKVVPGEIL